MNALAEGETPREESLLTYITLILKEGKNPAVPMSYRPISLLNTDIKIYAKIFAERLKLVLPSRIHIDQVGFVTGREGRDNCLKSMLLIHEVRGRGTPVAFLSIDAKKAFDRLDWGFMFRTLRHLGIGEKMMRWVSAFYHQPMAKINVSPLPNCLMERGRAVPSRQCCLY